MPDAPVFPDDFVFGVATSAYQVEGGIDNDWADWERAGRCKSPDARCGRAVDHWGRFDEDLGRITALGATAYRFSIEWARVEPARGVWDEAALGEYRRRLEALVAAGVRPVVTLHHFTHPRWFHTETPWHTPASLEAFERYARRCARLLDGLEVIVTTFNEPNVLLLGGYLGAQMPPGLADGAKAFAAAEHLVRAHVLARRALLETTGGLPRPIGIAQHLTLFAPSRRWHPLDLALTRLAETNFNHAFLEALHTGVLKLSMPGLTSGRAQVEGARRSMDFVGVNYYTRTRLRFVPAAPFVRFEYVDAQKRGLTDLGWEDYPEGFGAILRQAGRYGLPVWVTENGIDDREGHRRPDFIYRHLRQLLAARADGVDVRGWLYWSLLDNFEWLEAWGPRFGLYRVDFDTLERTPTPACDYFAQLARSRVLTPPPEPRQKPAP